MYEGTEGQPVRWRFENVGRPVVKESYTIDYAYTELWFDEPRDMWIALGSDDTSLLWINNMFVWKAVDPLKPWRINEGYRKAAFKQGLNRILYRVENGPAHGWFSLLLHPGVPSVAGTPE